MTPGCGHPTTPCKGCGKPVVWIQVQNDKGEYVRVPVDPRPPCYRFFPMHGWERDRDSMVSHFATCSKASEFSGANRNTTEGRAGGQHGGRGAGQEPREVSP